MNANQKDETLNSRVFYSVMLMIVLIGCLATAWFIVWVSSLFFPAILTFMGLFTLSLTLGMFSFVVVEIQMFLRKISVDGVNLDGIE